MQVKKLVYWLVVRTMQGLKFILANCLCLRRKNKKIIIRIYNVISEGGVCLSS